MTDGLPWFRRPSFYILVLIVAVILAIDPAINYVLDTEEDPSSLLTQAEPADLVRLIEVTASLAGDFYAAQGRLPETVEELVLWEKESATPEEVRRFTAYLSLENPADGEERLEVYAAMSRQRVATINTRGGYTLEDELREAVE